MSIFAVGDLHLALNQDIEKPMDVFGEAWVNHTERIAEFWRSHVTQDDTVIIVGDISWALKLEEAIPDLDFLHELPGQKVIVKGNHDLWWNGITKMNQLYDDIIFLQNTCYEAEGWFICGSRGWICPGDIGYNEEKDRHIYEREVGRLRRSLEAASARGAENIIGITHYPPTNDKLQVSDFTALYSEFGVKKACYGHLHGKDAFRKAMSGILNGVEYQLVSLDYLNCTLKKIV